MTDVIREDLPPGAINLIEDFPGTRVTYVDTALGIRTTVLDRHLKNGIARWLPGFWTDVPDQAMENLLLDALKREAPNADIIRVLYDGYSGPRAENGKLLPSWPRRCFLWAVTPV